MRAATCSLLWLAVACVALPATGQTWRLDAGTGLRLEDGGDARIDERSQASRRAWSVTPRLRWSPSSAGWSAEVGLAPGVELPPRRAGNALSRWGLSARLRRRVGDTRWSLSGEAGRVDFEAASRWTGRRRLSGRLQAERYARNDLVLSASYGYDVSRYGRVDAAVDPKRTDGRHGGRAGLLWYRTRRWLSASVGGLANGSTLEGHDYRAGQVYAGAGLSRGRLSASAQLSQEWRSYQMSAGGAWSLTWAGLRASWQLGPWAWVYAGAQREWGRAEGERLFAPWSLVESGLRFELPLAAAPRPRAAPHPALTATRLRPHPEGTGWVFRFPAEQADSVHLVGSFTGWDPEAHPMHRAGDAWETTVTLPPGIHEYAFLVDGHDWRVPPAAPYYVDDGFGRENGVVVVEAHTTAHAKGTDPR